MQKTANDFVREAYAVAGEYTNGSRHVPWLMDGCKPVYRKVILTALEQPQGKFIKTATLVGLTMAKRYVHGDASLGPVISELVRMKILDGQGNLGLKSLTGEHLSPAAPRYTEVRLNDRWRGLIGKFMKYIPTYENDLRYQEAEYLPLPIPLCLVTGSEGMGIGMAQKCPSFTLKSLIKASLTQDWKRLVFNYGYQVEDKKDIARLWLNPKGSLTLRLKMVESSDSEYKVVGSPDIFSVDIHRRIKGTKFGDAVSLNDLKEEGKILIRDQDDELIFRKRPRTRFDFEEVWYMIEELCRRKIGYNIWTVQDSAVRPISIREWLAVTLENYSQLVERYKSENIKRIEFQLVLYSKFREIAPLILEGKKKLEAIAEECKVEMAIVQEIYKMPIGTVRSTNPEKKIKSLKSKKDEFEELTTKKVLKEFVYGE